MAPAVQGIHREPAQDALVVQSSVKRLPLGFKSLDFGCTTVGELQLNWLAECTHTRAHRGELKKKSFN